MASSRRSKVTLADDGLVITSRARFRKRATSVTTVGFDEIADLSYDEAAKPPSLKIDLVDGQTIVVPGLEPARAREMVEAFARDTYPLSAEPGATAIDLARLPEEIAQLAGQKDCRISKLVSFLLSQAIANRASDLHLEPTSEGLEVRLRIDGVLHDVGVLPTNLQPNVTARVKVLADMITYRVDVPQDGRIPRTQHRGPVDLRVSTIPTIHGEKTVIRIFDPEARFFKLDELGFAKELTAALMALASRPQGTLLLTGPASSGKTTTIYSILKFLVARSKRTKNMVAIEDPVEYDVPGVVQVQVKPGAGFGFAQALRSTLRQDPEVLVVGEIRDEETAQIATQAGLTGHLVISTIHSGTAAGVFGRLLEMGIEPFLVNSSVTGVLAQRLVRVLCPACKQPSDQDDSPFRAIGCEACAGTGFHGRTAIAELLTMSPSLAEAILAKKSLSSLQQAAVDFGLKPILEDAAARVRQGLTTHEEVRRVLVVD